MNFQRHTTILAGAISLIASGGALAQACQPEWSSLTLNAQADGPIHALTVFDEDGAGPLRPALYAGGSFTTIGGVSTAGMARWDGVYWSSLGAGISGVVRALETFDQDGAGPLPERLIAAGEFNLAGGVPAANIAAWNGAAWSALGAGVDKRINVLESLVENGVPVLVVGGFFDFAGGAPARKIARWSSGGWSELGGGAGNEVLGIAAIDPDQAGPAPAALFVGGWFTSVGAGVPALRVARWDGAAWSALGAGLTGPFPVYARTFTSFDPDGSGPAPAALMVGGFFRTAGGLEALGLARWNGSNWSSVDGGIGYPAETKVLIVADDDGDGSHPARLFAGGSFLPVVGGPADNIATWDIGGWSPVGTGTNQVISAFATFQDDPGSDSPALIVAGGFTNAGGVQTTSIARWGCPRPPPSGCADANNDGTIDFKDVTTVLGNWGASYTPGASPPGPGDADSSGLVNFTDITAVLTAWGMVCR